MNYIEGFRMIMTDIYSQYRYLIILNVQYRSERFRKLIERNLKLNNMYYCEASAVIHIIAVELILEDFNKPRY